MGGACGLLAYIRKKKKFVQGFGWETCKIVTTWQTQACVEDDDIIMDIREVQVAGCCEHDNETLACIKCTEFDQ